MAYDPNKEYIFTNEETGETFTSKGDNGYVWQAMEEGLPLSVNSKGEWYVVPYVDRNSDGTITAYIPNWFKGTDAYSDWKNTVGSMTKAYAAAMTNDQLGSLNDYLKSLGGHGALQMSEIKSAKNFGLDDNYARNYYNNIVSAITELNGGDPAKITFSDGTQRSVSDIANEFKGMSKEEISEKVVEYQQLLAQAQDSQAKYGSYFPRQNLVTAPQSNAEAIQQKVADVLVTYKILDAINQKGSTYQNGDYVGLLDSSTHQQFMTGLASYASAGAQNPLVNLLMSGINSLAGIDETPQEYLQNYIAKNSSAGAGLEGREAAISVGGITGTVANLALTAAEIYLIGAGAGAVGSKLLNGGKIAQGIGGFLSGVSTFAMSPVGMLTSDFVVNDLPQDIAYFMMKGSQTGDWAGATLSVWGKPENEAKPYYNAEGKLVTPEPEYEQQKLVPFGIYPVQSEDGIVSLGVGLGPEVPSGLITDIAGDIIVDLSLPIVNNVFKVVSNAADTATGGAITRIKENISIKNLELQEKLTELPGIGTAWQKTVNAFMGASDANYIRQARKDAIAQHSMDPYIEAHNLLTLKNHGGSEAVAKAYMLLDKKWKVSEGAADFVKHKNQYGGKVGKVEISWKDTVGGEEHTHTRIVDDVLPEQVKQGVMDVERLAELRGLKEGEEGLVSNPAREKEIAAIEKRLENTPQDIKDFADRLSGLNKDVERLGVVFGVTNESWLNHILQDPQFAKYMTRQALVPVQKTSSYVDSQKKSAQWTKSRTGSYSDKYVDPIIALNMKVAALGRTVVDNEMAKSLVGFQKSQGNIVRGQTGIDLGERIKENTEKIRGIEGTRERLGYDNETGKYTSDMNNVTEAVKGVWDMMLKPEEINLKSVYQADQNKVIYSHVNDFTQGKISFADGVREKAGLSETEASVMVKNTYRIGDQRAADTEGKLRPQTQPKAPAPAPDPVVRGKTGVVVKDLDSFLETKDINVKAMGTSAAKIFDDIAGRVIYGDGGSWRVNGETTEALAVKELSLDFLRASTDDLALIAEQLGKGLITQNEAAGLARTKIGDAIKKVLRDDEYAKLFGGKTPVEPKKPVGGDYAFPRISEQRESALRTNQEMLQEIFDDYSINQWRGFKDLTDRGVLKLDNDDGVDYIRIKDDATLDELEEVYNRLVKEDFIDPEAKEGLDFDRFTDWDTIREMNPNQLNFNGKLSEGIASTGSRKHVWSQEDWNEFMYILNSVGNFNLANDAAGKSSKAMWELHHELWKKAGGEKYKGQPKIEAIRRYAETKLREEGVSKTIIDSVLSEAFNFRKGEGENITNEVPIADTLAETPEYAGMTAEGVPYSYKVVDGKITEINKITTPAGVADSVRCMGYDVADNVVATIGLENSYALNRTALFYRDNAPKLPLSTYFGVEHFKKTPLGCIKGFTNPSYGWRVENGKVAANYGTYMEIEFFAEKHQGRLKHAMDRGVAGWLNGEIGFHPKNSNAPENTTIHETGHAYMLRLTVLDFNRRVDEGDAEAIKLVKQWEGTDAYGRRASMGVYFDKEWEKFQTKLAKRAMDKMGIKYNGNNWMKVWCNVSGVDPKTAISEYAALRNDTHPHGFMYETFSEMFVDYWANGEKASPWTLALIQEVFDEAKKYGMTALPKDVMEGNGLKTKGLFKGDDYAFPDTAKTVEQKAKWLDEQRQKNPYINGKGLLSEEDYKLANLWDTYFRKEAMAYDPNIETKMPAKLVKKNGDFQEDVAKNGADYIMNRIKENSVDGFDNNLATILLSKNQDDILDALEDFISKRIDTAAENIAKNLGEVNEDNMMKARATLYADKNMKDETLKMVASLMPDMDTKAASDMVNNFFDKQAKGFASVDALPIDAKNLIAETDALREKLHKENSAVKKFGANKDKGLSGKYVDSTHVISYREAGEDVYVVVKDPVIAGILKRPNNYKETGLVAESFVHMGNFLSRTYRLGTTGINPIALVRNVLRDPLQASLTAGFNPLDINISPVAFYKTLRQFGLDDATIKSVTERLSEWAKGQTLTQQLREDKINANTIANAGYRNKFEKNIKKIDKLTNNKIVNAAEKPLEMWEDMLRTQIAQQSFTKAYKKTGDVDRALSRAMFDASNATTNFSHSINKFQRAASTVPYLTSAINGTTSFWRLFNIDPVGMTARIAGGFMVPVMAITAWNLSSEERRKEYMNLPEWWRDGHLILMDEDGNKIFAFTIPEEVSAYYGTVRRLIEYTQEANPASIPTILAQGALGLLPGDTDGFVDDYGNWQVGRGLMQYTSGLVPQAVNTAYEWFFEENLYTGQDLSNYKTWDKVINALTNVFGTGIKNVINDVGYLCGASEKDLLGKTTKDTLARDLFGMGFDNATTQFLNLIGHISKTGVDGKEIKATGLFAENEKLQSQIATLKKNYAFQSEEEKAEVDKQCQELIDNFTNRVATMVHKYMELYSMTGGLTAQQKNQIVSILNLGNNFTSANGSTAEALAQEEANSGEYGLAVQRYVESGLPSGPTLDSLATNKNGNRVNSLAVKAALNRYYGSSKQAKADLTNALTNSNIKQIRSEFYDAIQKIYDAADAQGKSPDYELIEKIQARFLQSIDGVLIPIINTYGNNILSNNDFINELRSYVNGMIPSDDWRQSTKNAKKFLSTKEFPTATVDVKKWLQNRYSSGMRDRNIASDTIVVDTLTAIKEDIDSGRKGAAESKIKSLINGMNKANFYISSKDLQTLYEYNNMLK